VFSGRGFGVGLTVADLTPPGPEFGPPVSSSPALAQMLPVYARSAAEKAAELQRVQALKAELAAYEIELVAAFAADRPASLGRRPGSPGAAVPGENTAPEGVSEFFADELAATLNRARATATVLTEHTLTLTTTLRATLAELAQGRLDWPWARTIAEELGWPVRDTPPGVLAEVEAAVLPEAAGLPIRRLEERLRAEPAARDAAADRRRQQAQRATTSTHPTSHHRHPTPPTTQHPSDPSRGDETRLPRRRGGDSSSAQREDPHQLPRGVPAVGDGDVEGPGHVEVVEQPVGHRTARCRRRTGAPRG
jgi:hypothetical protein